MLNQLIQVHAGFLSVNENLNRAVSKHCVGPYGLACPALDFLPRFGCTVP
jgi:hypothetical protein